MKITDLKINRLKDLFAVDWHDCAFSFLADEEPTEPFLAALCEESGRVLTQKTARAGSLFSFEDFLLEPGKKYWFCVSGNGASAKREFETAPPLTAPWITPADKELFAPAMTKTFSVAKLPRSARLCITGLGLYRAELNGKRVGDAYLTPGFNDYDTYVRYQTYDVTAYLVPGENTIKVYLGDGWYRGRIGIDKPIETGDRVYGERYLLCASLIGEGEVLVQTDQTWQAHPTACRENSIYDGEFRDLTISEEPRTPCVIADVAYTCSPEENAPIREQMTRTPTKLLSPKGEQILDFGQNMVGFVRFTAKEKKGTKITLSHGEVLQDGCFYADNLRTARAQAIYIANGLPATCEPMFSYFGFRYVKVEGIENVNPADFSGVVICSDLPVIISCTTDNEKINRLMQNALWGQRGNFLDVPTDCPQRDERLGWTADTQVFSKTAAYQMDVYPFYRKYLHDLRVEQTRYYGGDFPMYAPSLRGEAGHGGAVWADCGTILPWNLYQSYGDRALLARSYPMMRDYTELLIARDREQGGANRILHGFTFGDWLAQDGVCPQSLAGGTDDGFIMAVYYYHSVTLTANAAHVIGEGEDAARYREKASRIRDAILDEYFAPGGKLALDTQTAYVLALTYGIYRDRDRVISDFRARLAKDFYRMKTGFTGTPLMLSAMIDNDMIDDAYRILYNEECPGWLYAVNLGATTIWERWNSLLPDGHISGTNMNSLNHYAYGSVCETIYSRMAGLRLGEAGWRQARIQPHPHYRMKRISLVYDSPAGRYEIAWEITPQGEFRGYAVIPAGCRAVIALPGKAEIEVGSGRQAWSCPAPSYCMHPFTLDTPNLDILKNPQAAEAMRRILPRAYAMVTGENEEFLIRNGHFLAMLPMFGTTPESMAAYEKALAAIRG